MKNYDYDVIILGAGAAGLMAAVQASKRGKKVLLIEHTNKIGEKIRISGGGRCNFTNLNIRSSRYISRNPHFMKSALASYTQYDFINLVDSHKIKYYEKTLGQLFCEESSKQIISMLVELCKQGKVEIKLNCTVSDIIKDSYFRVNSSQGIYQAISLIVATGGLSIPKLGATNFGYKLAKKFGLNIIPTKPALVPLVVHESAKELCTHLSGVSNRSIVKYQNVSFAENILFTHKGLSGPAILQISSYLENNNNTSIIINLLPDIDLKKQFIIDKHTKQLVTNYLKPYLSNRLINELFGEEKFQHSITDLNKKHLFTIADILHNFKINIIGNEGYNKAEVTCGGIDTDELSSKTMESKKIANLFFVGEVVDVTGWLGGYNFQWAWSSGFVAGNNC